MRWFGPEVVLRGVRVLERDGSAGAHPGARGQRRARPLEPVPYRRARGGARAVRGPDAHAWSGSRTGASACWGRTNGRWTARPSTSTGCPAGRLVVEDATVTLSRSRGPGPRPSRSRRLQVDLRRQHGSTAVAGSARLARLRSAARIEFRGDLRGSLEHFDALDAAARAQAWTGSSCPGSRLILPSWVARPIAGSGQVEGEVQFTQGALAHARLDLGLDDVGLVLPDARRCPPSRPSRCRRPRGRRARRR